MGDPTYEETAQSLEAQYSPLDAALIRAILSEYDHTDAEQSQTLHETLETLRAEAIADDTASFDPSGTSGGDALTRVSPEKSTSEGWDNHTESGVTASSDTDVTNLSYELKHTRLNKGTVAGTASSDAEKQLLELFPSQTQSTISYTLKKCGGHFDTAVDVLLNHVYFDEPADGEEKVARKGVDAFSDDLIPQKRKRKGRKRFQSASLDSAWSSSESLSSTASTNHWQTAAKDIEFLASRTSTAPKNVQSLYNKHGASISATIVALVEQHAGTSETATSDDPLEELNIATLASEFPSIPLHTIAGLVRVSAPSTAHAHELAKALVTPSPRAAHAAALVGGKLMPQYAPLRIDEDPETISRSSFAASDSTPLSASALANLRSNAFESASGYHRKAGSNHLFGGAAAYYGQLGREYDSQLRAATSAEADALVSSQSNDSVLDLHGVSVADAVRISETRTQRWWDGVRLKEGRSANERVGGGFIIVTGRGVHSKDGRGRIGPAVTRALIKEGWKVEVATGEVTVRGRAREQKKLV